MDLKSLGQTIIALGFPLLGSAVAGPAGYAIGQIVASEFGGDAKNPLSLADKIEGDPNAHVKLAEIESNQKVQLQNIAMLMAENDLKFETQQMEIDFQNTKSARENNAQTKSWMPEILSGLIIIGFFGCVYWIAAYPQDKSDSEILYMLLGSVSMSFGAVINYWLGSSVGSRNKDFLLKKK